MVKKVRKKRGDVQQSPFGIVKFDKQFKDDYVEYGTYIAQERSLADVRDGLKPVARRILYTMWKNKFTLDKPYKKSARIVGIVMGDFHPHGDSSIYEAMVRLAQEWALPLSFVDFRGNKGNRNGDGPAAQRYTEARMSELASLTLERLNKESVKFKSNYANDQDEPEVLPIPIPLLLINGNDGIVSGFISKIPPHNPLEVLAAFKLFCKRKRVKLSDIIKVMPAPDFPTGGEIYRLDEMQKFYETGEASAKVRGKTTIEDGVVVIRELPWIVSSNIDGYFEKLLDKMSDGTIKNAQSAENFSNKKNGVEIRVKPVDDVSPEILERELYVKTQLQGTIPLRFNVIKDGIPATVNLLEYFEEFREFALETIRKYSEFELKKLNHSILIKKGLISALDQIDVVIELIRSSKTKSQIIKGLTTGEVSKENFRTVKNFKLAQKFNFTTEQAEEIVRIPLGRLSNLSRVEMETDLEKLTKNAAKLEKIISNRKEQEKVLLSDITKFEKYFEKSGNYSRKTTLSQESDITFSEDEIVRKSILTVTKFGYLRKLSEKSGVDSQEIFRKSAMSNQSFVVFTNKGNLYNVKVSDISNHTLKNKGESLSEMFKLGAREYPLLSSGSLLLLSKGDGDPVPKDEVLFISSDGFGKRVPISEFIISRKKSSATKLKTGAELVSAEIIPGDKSIAVFVTELGCVKAVKVADLPVSGRNTIGNSVGGLLDGDKVTQAFIVNKSDSIDIFGKTISVSSLKLEKLNTKIKKM